MSAKTIKKAKDGEGSVYQLPNKRWVGKLYIGRKADGKPNRKTFSGKTESEVRKKIREFNKNKDKYSQENITSLSFEEYINNWLYTYRRNQLKPSSFDRLESTIKNHIVPNLGYLQLSNVEAKDIQNLINNMFDNGLSHSSIKKVYDACNAVLKYAVIKDLKHNPMQGVEMPSIKLFKKSKIRYFNKKEIEEFEKEATRNYKTGTPVYKNGYAFILMMNTGIRESEVLGIDKNRDIDLEKNILKINKNVITVKVRDKSDYSNIMGYETKLQDTVKTDAGNRIIPLNKKAKIAIIELIKNSNDNSNLLISNANGQPLSPTTISKSFSKITFSAGIGNCGTHALRHTFASRLFKKGVDIKIISELLGHANVSITYNTYIHLINEQKVKAIQSLDLEI